MDVLAIRPGSSQWSLQLSRPEWIGTERDPVVHDLPDMVRQPKGQRHNRQRWIGLTGCREHCTAGDIEVAQTMYAAIPIDYTGGRTMPHPCGANMMPAIGPIAGNLLFNPIGIVAKPTMPPGGQVFPQQP